MQWVPNHGEHSLWPLVNTGSVLMFGLKLKYCDWRIEVTLQEVAEGEWLRFSEDEWRVLFRAPQLIRASEGAKGRAFQACTIGYPKFSTEQCTSLALSPIPRLLKSVCEGILRHTKVVHSCLRGIDSTHLQ